MYPCVRHLPLPPAVPQQACFREEELILFLSQSRRLLPSFSSLHLGDEAGDTPSGYHLTQPLSYAVVVVAVTSVVFRTSGADKYHFFFCLFVFHAVLPSPHVVLVLWLVLF